MRFEETITTAVEPGEEIVKILSKNNTPRKINPTKKMTQYDINQRLNAILSDD